MNDRETREWMASIETRDMLARAIARDIVQGVTPERGMVADFAAADASAHQYLVTR